MEIKDATGRSLKIGIILLLSSLLPWTLSVLIGQTYAFQHFTDQDGVPSRYLYSIQQDKEGHIWLTGEAGMVWYDGKTYKKPPIQPFLKDEVIMLYKDDNQSIWMQDLRSVISLYKDGVYRRFEQISPSRLHNHLSIFSASENEVWIVNNDGLHCFDYASDVLYKIPIDTSDKRLTGRKFFHKDGQGNIILLSQRGYFLFKGKESTFYNYCDSVRYQYGDIGFTANGKVYITKEDGLYSFNDGCITLLPEFASFRDIYNRVVNGIYQDSEGRFWFLTRNGLIESKKNKKGTYSNHLHLEGEVMGDMLEDYEGNLWFTTSHNGLYKLASTKVNNFVSRGLDKQLRFVKQNRQKQLVLGFDNNQYKVLDKDFKIKYEGKLFEQNYRLYDFEQDELGQYYFISSSGITVFDKNFKHRKDYSPDALKAAAFTSDGKLWLAAGDFIGYISLEGEFIELQSIRSYAVYPVSEEEVWFGTIEGPVRYKNGKEYKVQNIDLQVDIRDIAPLEDGVLCFASQNRGLFFYDINRDSIRVHLTTENGLSSNFCSNVMIDKDFVWLTTKNGLNRISRNDYSVTILGIDQGIPSNEINGLIKADGIFYLATNKGLAYFDEDYALNKIPPRLELSSIRIAQRDTTLHPKYQLDYSKNSIGIEFNGITFKNNASLVYEYKMEGIDANWNRSNVGVAQYHSIPPGNYTFLARAKTNNTNWSILKKVQFQISPPIWQRTWFIALSVLLGYFILWMIFVDIKRRSKQAKNLKSSQLTAIRAQMNPHFVFNALNSIQEFIVKRDIRSTNRYLSQFARLMRNVLNVSDKEQISLKKEIETLKLYLSLEALRFGEQFDYTFELEEDLDVDDLYLPPMLVQPFVENAIKHGLMHREGIKRLYLRFRKENNFLICEVEDNGVGRAKSAEIRKNNPRLYSSKSTSLTQQRLKVFNSARKDTLHLKIEDLITEGVAMGTKVTIKVNKRFNETAIKSTRQTLEV
jgi:ligand-binding sensor domain-containing protein